MKYPVLLLSLLFLLVAVSFAQNETDKGVVTFNGGIMRGSADYPGNHLFLGGGGYGYPFRDKNVLARRLAVGFELSRGYLETSEEFDTGAYGPGRIQAQMWFISPQVRYDLLRWKYVRVVTHAGYNAIRERLAFQIIDPYQYGKHWYTMGSVGQWHNVVNAGLSVAFVLPRRDYSGQVVPGAWAFPVKLMQYSNGLQTLTFGVERYF